jgi:hypothetical protein
MSEEPTVYLGRPRRLSPRRTGRSLVSGSSHSVRSRARDCDSGCSGPRWRLARVAKPRWHMAAPITAAMPDGPAGPAESFAAPCKAAALMVGGPAPSSGSGAAYGHSEAGCVAQSPVGARRTRSSLAGCSAIPGATSPPSRRRRRRRLREELDLLGAPVLHAAPRHPASPPNRPATLPEQRRRIEPRAWETPERGSQ